MSQDKIIITTITVEDFLTQKKLRSLLPLYRYLCACAAKGVSSTTLSILSKKANVSRRTVFTYLDKLESLNLIYRKNHGQNGLEIVLIGAERYLKMNSATNSAISRPKVLNNNKLTASENLTPMNSAMNSAISVAKALDTNNLEAKEKTTKPNKNKIGHVFKEPILDTKTYSKPNIPTQNLGIAQDLSITQNLGVAQDLGPSQDFPVTQYLSDVTSKKKAPKLPITAKDYSQCNPEFPLNGVATHVSAILYWAVKRYVIHDLDFLIIKDTFAKTAAKFSKTIPKLFGNDFAKMQEYVDWYLSSKDKFIAREVKYGLDYMTSNSCMNKYLAETSKKTAREMVTNDEERSKLRGKWHR